MSRGRSTFAALVETVTRPDRLRLYRTFLATQYDRPDLRRARQDAALAASLEHAERTVPYYAQLFAGAGIHAGDIRGVEALPALPVLTKSTIRANSEAFHSPGRDARAFVPGRTGGSTGEPLTYRMSPEDYHAGVALQYRGWGCAGFRPGDRVVVVAGGSLTSISPDAATLLKDRVFNRRHLSSYGMTAERMSDYLLFISRWQPAYLFGYASSLFALSQHALSLGMTVGASVRGVFTTSECLSARARAVIEQAFGCAVFDTYGLNDGGVSAYECDRHSGFHVDMERAVLEVVDDAGRPVVGRPGRILATSLLNRAMPFIRYDTGDVGVMSADVCSCGRTSPILSSVLGRLTDLLVLDGVTIGSPVLTVLMGTTSARWYQVVQTGGASVTFRIVNPDVRAREDDEQRIRASLHAHVGNRTTIEFEYVDAPDDVAAGEKHRVVVNRSGADRASPGESVRM